MAARSVTIVTPVCGGWPHLERCVASCKEHVGARHRILILDDASPDPDLPLRIGATERDALERSNAQTLHARYPECLPAVRRYRDGLPAVERFADVLGCCYARKEDTHRSLPSAGRVQRHGRIRHGSPAGDPSVALAPA